MTIISSVKSWLEGDIRLGVVPGLILALIEVNHSLNMEVNLQSLFGLRHVMCTVGYSDFDVF
jgi:hypothetical protein